MNEKTSAAEIPAVILFGKDETSKPHASYFHEADLAGALNAATLMKMKVLRTDTDERRAVAAELPQGRVFASGRAFVPFVAAPVYQRLVALAAGADSICPAGAGWGPGGPENESAASPESNRGPFAQPEAGEPPPGPVTPNNRAAHSIGPAEVVSGPVIEKNASTAAPESNRGHLGGPVGAGVVLVQPGQAEPPETAQTQASGELGHLTPGALVLASVGSAEGWWNCTVLAVNDDLLTLSWRDWPEEPHFVRRRSQIALLHPTKF